MARRARQPLSPNFTVPSPPRIHICMAHLARNRSPGIPNLLGRLFVQRRSRASPFLWASDLHQERHDCCRLGNRRSNRRRTVVSKHCRRPNPPRNSSARHPKVVGCFLGAALLAWLLITRFCRTAPFFDSALSSLSFFSRCFRGRQHHTLQRCGHRWRNSIANRPSRSCNHLFPELFLVGRLNGEIARHAGQETPSRPLPASPFFVGMNSASVATFRRAPAICGQVRGLPSLCLFPCFHV